MTVRRWLTIGIGALLSVPLTARATAAAAPDPPGGRVEQIGVGVAATLCMGAIKWGTISLRVSVPAGDKLGVDFDIGYVISPKVTQGALPFGWTAASHLRWKPKGRSDTGWSGYLLGGPRVMQMRRRLDDPASAYWQKFADVGVGVDHVLDQGSRLGIEFGGNAAGGFLTGVALWGRVPAK